MLVQRLLQASRTRDVFDPWNDEKGIPPLDNFIPLLGADVVQHAVIYTAEEPYTFSIGQSMELHNGVLYCFWAQSDGPENGPNEFARGAISTDYGVTWGAPQAWFPDIEGDRNRSHGSMLSHDGELYAFVTSYFGTDVSAEDFPGLLTELWRWNDTTQVFDLLGPIGSGYPIDRPKRMPNGDFIMGCVDSFARPMVLISQGGDVTQQWQAVRIRAPRWPSPVYSETTTMIDGNRVFAFIRQEQAEGMRAWTAVSRDYGRTWTDARRSNFPMTSKKPFCDTLSTGEKYLICCLYGFDNLVVYFRERDEQRFSRVFRFREDSPPPPRFEGAQHTAGWGYPWGVEVTDGEGVRWLIVSHYNAKEDVWCSRIRIDALLKPPEQLAPLFRWEMKETAGTTIADTSGNGRNGTVIGPALWGGGGLTTTANGQGAVLNDPLPLSVFNQSSDFTFALWGTFTTNGGTQTLVGQGNDPDLPARYAWKLETVSVASGRVRPNLTPSGSVNQAYQPQYPTPPLNTPVHHVWRFANGRMSLHVNGVEQAVLSPFDPDPVPLASFRLAAPIMLSAVGFAGAPTNTRRGKLSRAAMWNRWITDAEIAAEYAYGPNGPLPDYSIYDPDARIRFEGMALPPPVGLRDAINNLTLGLKAAGIWEDCDLIRLTGLHDREADYGDLRSPAFPLRPGTGIPVPAWTAFVGLAGNGVDQRLQDDWRASTNAVRYTLNSASLWIYNRTNRAAVNNNFAFGNTGSPSMNLNPRAVGDVIQGRINNNATISFANAAARSDGFFGLQRINSTTMRAWRNGVQQGGDATANSSSLPTQVNFLCGAALSTYSTDVTPVVIVAASLAGKEAALNTLIQDYIAAVGALA